MDDARSIVSKPPNSLDLGDVVVCRYGMDDAVLLHDAIAANVEHLRPWMAWVAREPLEMSDRETFLADSRRAWDEGRDFMMGIFSGGTLIGSTGLHLRGPEGTVEIGYWVSGSHVGRGIATRVVRELTKVALALEEIDIVEIHHDAANMASRRVVEKSGFSLVGESRREPEAPGESGLLLRWISVRG